MYCIYGGSKHQDVIHDHYKTCLAQFKAYKGLFQHMGQRKNDMGIQSYIFRTPMAIRNDTRKPSFQILFRKNIFTLIP